MLKINQLFKAASAALFSMFFILNNAHASEIDLHIPSLNVAFNIFGTTVTGSNILLAGMGVCILGMLFGLYEFIRIKNLPAHRWQHGCLRLHRWQQSTEPHPK